ncbi:protein RETICULATA-RELATED 3, chloroplastic-like [Salvia miltiorrhiza]|uniref:protein RETICULATA-RELATED 3, chloroplastic-like n=1 Tax=Salvia miltiorrhiza TaxID=226208 RepID=UPI0025AB7D2A|nr:protein RETICULATA-RELATED 3, chloroplastic-like [Salvia miltiorrhiza]
MAAMAQLCCSPLSGHRCLITTSSSSAASHSLPFSQCTKIKFSNPNLESKLSTPHAAGGGNAGINSGGGGGGGDNGGSGSEGNSGFGPIGAFLTGWRERVAADPQFPFKVVMEELVGVSACIVGDMASRPNFGLNELDFVFSTIVVGSILNLLLMYILAPTSSSLSQSLPWIFAGCPASHMFEAGGFTVMERLGTFVYKGAVFGGAGFVAGLVGTAISNGLIELRKKVEPEFVRPNKAPPTLLNASAWAVQLGVSSNLRYQVLNAVEFILAKRLPLNVFKSLVVLLRCFNNVLGGMSFVAVARWTGSQIVEGEGEGRKID